MKYIFIAMGSVIAAVSIVSLGFTLRQITQEKETLTTNLEQRTELLAESLKESVVPYYVGNDMQSAQKIVDRFSNRERLAGLVLYDNKGVIIAISSGLPPTISEDHETVANVMDSDVASGNFIEVDNEMRYVLVEPLRHEDSVIGALVVVQNSGYISTSIREIWERNLLRLGIQVLLFSLAIFLIFKVVIFRQIARFAESVRRLRSGDAMLDISESDKFTFFKPLEAEIAHITKSLFQARMSASEEARMRLEKIDTPWTAARLREFIKVYLKDRPIFVVSNREPYEHQKTKGLIEYRVPAGGVVTALEPVMESCGGTWIAHGSGSADRLVVDEHDKIAVPPEDPKYTLKRVWLDDKEVNGYYKGFSNEALWPLCLLVHTRPLFRKEDWEIYQEVNEKFAKSVLAEIKSVPNPLILVQDYHLALLPSLIKKKRPDAQVGMFWHIPWPSPESFSVCPWRKEILRGMLGADIIGFHTQQFCNNFINTVSKEIESLADLEQFSITQQGHTSYIKPFPISIAFTDNSGDNYDPSLGRAFVEKLGIRTKYLGLGVDRMDYTKGLLERFKAIEFFLDTHPSYKGEFTFLQIAAPSRESVPKYRQFAEEVTKEAVRVNEKFKTKEWQPIMLVKEHHTREEIGPLYRIADVCLVTSLHDGMNLVAKEYVSARDDDRGVLVLSQFTGAVRDLKGALVVNPYSAEETSEAINVALQMPAAEQEERMKKMRNSVKNYNVYRWSAEFIKAVASLS